MGFYALIALINALASSILGIFVYFKNRKQIINKIFALFCLSVAVWSYPYFIWQISTTESAALFWSRALMVGAIFIPICYFHFILELLNKIKQKKKLLIFGYIVFFFFLLANFTSLFVKGVRPKLGFAFWPDAGILYHPFLLIWFFYAFYAVYLLFKNYFVSIGIKQNQIRYILIGTIIGYLGGATNYFLWYDIPIPPIGNWTTAFYLGIVAYAIVRYRFMDIRVVVKRSTIFSGLVVGVATAYVLVAFLLASLVYGGELAGIRPLIVTGLLIGVLTALGFRPLYGFLQRTTDRYLFKGEYQPEELIRRVSDKLATALEIERITKILTQEISQAMRLKGAELGRVKGYELKAKNLVHYLQKKKETLVLEEMRRQYQEREKYDQRFLAYKDLEKIGRALVVPVYQKSELAALFFLKEKKSGDMFTDQDIRTLEIITSQAGIALENASMYEKMKDFSKTLQKEVDTRTKELKEANIRLQMLDKAKSEFISIASHQLRTPLTAIKGLVSMALESFWGPLNQSQKKYLGQVYQSGERLLKLIEDLLSISRIEAGKMEFIFQPVDLEKITQDVVQELLPQAKQKGLYLRLIKSKERLGRVKADSLKIRQVIQNLIDNALKYTIRGGASVRLQQKDNQIIFSVADTGLGIPADLKPVLFEKFHRGKGAITRHTEGTGLGLYLAAKLIEAHQGKIWVESEGEGKGSTFYFSLPVVK